MRRVRRAIWPRRASARVRAMPRAAGTSARTALRDVRRAGGIRSRAASPMRALPEVAARLCTGALARALSALGRGQARYAALSDPSAQIRARSGVGPCDSGVHRSRVTVFIRRLRPGHPRSAPSQAPLVARLQPGGVARRRGRAQARPSARSALAGPHAGNRIANHSQPRRTPAQRARRLRRATASSGRQPAHRVGR